MEIKSKNKWLWKNGLKLVEEIEKMNLVEEDQNAIIEYIKKEIQNGTRNILNMSLGTTIKNFIPINKLQEKDSNFDYNKKIDELALPIYNLIINYKNQIEESKK